jgi:hypothetical protein
MRRHDIFFPLDDSSVSADNAQIVLRKRRRESIDIACCDRLQVLVQRFEQTSSADAIDDALLLLLLIRQRPAAMLFGGRPVLMRRHGRTLFMSMVVQETLVRGFLIVVFWLLFVVLHHSCLFPRGRAWGNGLTE